LIAERSKTIVILHTKKTGKKALSNKCPAVFGAHLAHNCALNLNKLQKVTKSKNPETVALQGFAGFYEKL
jgi:hypothetical protein